MATSKSTVDAAHVWWKSQGGALPVSIDAILLDACSQIGQVAASDLEPRFAPCIWLG